MMSRTRVRLLVPLCGVVLFGAAVALTAPRVICHGTDARRVKAQADILAIEEAIETYRVDRGSAPDTLEQLTASDGRRPPYLDYLPFDPWGRRYVYTTDGARYSIVSRGADGTPGGDGPNADVTNRFVWETRPSDNSLQPTRAEKQNVGRQSPRFGSSG